MKTVIAIVLFVLISCFIINEVEAIEIKNIFEEIRMVVNRCPGNPKEISYMDFGLFCESTVQPCENLYGRSPVNGSGEYPNYTHILISGCADGQRPEAQYSTRVVRYEFEGDVYCCLINYPGPPPENTEITEEDAFWTADLNQNGIMDILEWISGIAMGETELDTNFDGETNINDWIEMVQMVDERVTEDINHDGEVTINDWIEMVEPATTQFARLSVSYNGKLATTWSTLKK